MLDMEQTDAKPAELTKGQKAHFRKRLKELKSLLQKSSHSTDLESQRELLEIKKEIRRVKGLLGEDQ